MKYTLNDHLAQIAYHIQELINTLSFTAAIYADSNQDLSRRMLNSILLFRGIQILIHPTVLNRYPNQKDSVIAAFLSLGLPYPVLLNGQKLTDPVKSLYLFTQPNPKKLPLQNPVALHPSDANKLILINDFITTIKVMLHSTKVGIAPGEASEKPESPLLDGVYILFTIAASLLDEDLPLARENLFFPHNKLNKILSSRFHIEIQV